MPASLSRLVAAAAVFMLSACTWSSTQIVSSWRDPEVSGVVLHKVLAVAIVKNEARRRAIEDRMVADIEKQGALAVPSYRLITADQTRKTDAVKAATLQGGFDGAVTWRTIADNHENHFVPGSVGAVPVGYRDFWGYYDMGWATIYDPGYIETDRVVRVETMVYEVAPQSSRLVWVGTSETVDPRSLDSLVDSVSDATVSAMRRENMFAQR